MGKCCQRAFAQKDRVDDFRNHHICRFWHVLTNDDLMRPFRDHGDAVRETIVSDDASCSLGDQRLLFAGVDVFRPGARGQHRRQTGAAADVQHHIARFYLRCDRLGIGAVAGRIRQHREMPARHEHLVQPFLENLRIVVPGIKRKGLGQHLRGPAAPIGQRHGFCELYKFLCAVRSLRGVVLRRMRHLIFGQLLDFLI